jgi:hypothetical protein
MYKLTEREMDVLLELYLEWRTKGYNSLSRCLMQRRFGWSSKKSEWVLNNLNRFVEVDNG